MQGHIWSVLYRLSLSRLSKYFESFNQLILGITQRFAIKRSFSSSFSNSVDQAFFKKTLFIQQWICYL